MSQYKLKITNKALADMGAIYKYIAEILQAPDTALKQYDQSHKMMNWCAA